jgi:hypothetical protein
MVLEASEEQVRTSGSQTEVLARDVGLCSTYICTIQHKHRTSMPSVGLELTTLFFKRYTLENAIIIIGDFGRVDLTVC